MSKTLRTLTDSRFTTKGSELTSEEIDQNWIDNEDEKQAISDQLALSAGGVLFGVQIFTDTANWNGVSASVHLNTAAGEAKTLTLPTANCVAGTRLYILDITGGLGDSGTSVVVVGEGGEPINGVGEGFTLDANYEYLLIEAYEDEGSPGLGWVIIGSNA